MEEKLNQSQQQVTKVDIKNRLNKIISPKTVGRTPPPYMRKEKK